MNILLFHCMTNNPNCNSMEECHIICQLQLEDLENSFDINIDNKYTKFPNPFFYYNQFVLLYTHAHIYKHTQ